MNYQRLGASDLMHLKAILLVCLPVVLAAMQLSVNADQANISPFLQKYCEDCHDADTKKGNLDLTSLQFSLQSPTNFATWVKVHDRVASGEMPPKKKARPDAPDLIAFTNLLSSSLMVAETERISREGRATERRLNRYEYEDTLRDLLSLPYLEVKSFACRRTARAYGFNKVGEA